MDLKKYAQNIEFKDGIWYSKNNPSNSIVSYRSDGNEFSYQIEENSFWFKHRNNFILKAIQIYSPNKFFFDIGGGNGFVAAFLEKYGIETILIEPGIKGIINAQKRNLKNLICSTLEDGEFYKESIPCIGLFDVIEHLKDDLEFLKTIYYLMENQGYLFLTVPAYNFLWSEEDVNAGHFRRYTLRDLKIKLEKSGFKIEYETYVFSFLPIPIFLLRTLNFKLKKNIKKEKKNNQEHFTKQGFIVNCFNIVLSWELKIIEAKRKIPFGGSCFIVAKKDN